MSIQDLILSREDFISRIREGGLSLVENHIVVGDSVELLKWLPENCVDLIHTSPPYNIDKRYRGGQPDLSIQDAYCEFLGEAIGEIKRVIKPNGSVFWQTGYTQVQNGISGDILPIDMLTYEHFRYEPHRTILWDRIVWRYFGGMAFKRKLTNKHETVLWYVKPNGHTAEPHFEVDHIREKSKELDKRNNFWGRNPGNVWEVDRVAFGSVEQSSHIAVFPEEISEKIARACSQPSDLLVDPFSGSGTLPKVARSLGRRWLAIEISDDYALESARRLGYQQPSEVWSLASNIIKFEIFRGRRQTMEISNIARTLSWWLTSIDTTSLRSDFESLTERALADRTRARKDKVDAWVDLNRRIEEQHPKDAVAIADSYLVRDYKNRRNLNGPMRYRTALDLLDALRSYVIGNGQSPEDLVQQIVEQEPSSYTIDGTGITLNTTEKRLKRSEPSMIDSDFEVPAVEQNPEPTKAREPRDGQSRMPL